MAETKELVFSVTGMTCGGCEKGITQAVGRLTGVIAATADRIKKEARVTCDAEAVTPDQIVAGRYRARGNSRRNLPDEPYRQRSAEELPARISNRSRRSAGGFFFLSLMDTE